MNTPMNSLPNTSLVSLPDIIKLWQQGDLHAAASSCEEFLRHEKHNLDALNLAGIIADQQNKKQSAIEYFTRAVALAPNNPQLVTNLAGSLVDLGEFSRAKNLLLGLTDNNLDYAEAYYMLGNIYFQEGYPEEAKKSFFHALELEPTHHKALNNLASIASSEGDNASATVLYQRALKVKPDFLQSLTGLAAIYIKDNETASAESLLKKAISISPFDEQANFLLGKLCLESQGDDGEALQYLQTAYQRSPKNIAAINMLASLYFKLDELLAAEKLFLESLAVKPDQLAVLNYLGQINHELRKHEKSTGYYEQALALDPENARIMNNLGHVLREKGELKKSITVFNQAIELQKDKPTEERSTALNNLSLTQLLTQDFAAGWDNYRFRPSMIEGDLPVCPDKKTIDLRHKKILWHWDQGIGDELFFLRFAPLLEKFNCRSDYYPSKKLFSVLKGSNIFNNIVETYDPVDYDLVLSIGDIAYLTNHGSAADTPWPVSLKHGPRNLQQVKSVLQQFGPPPYIGFTWKAGRMVNEKRVGNYFKRMEIEEMGVLLDKMPGTLVSLQVNSRKEELETLSRLVNRPVLDVSLYHEQLDRMLALLDCLDEYITVSNTYVHFRESLGKPSHVFVSNPPEWRWLPAGESSFWMPNSKVYRQGLDGSWKEAIEKAFTAWGSA